MNGLSSTLEVHRASAAGQSDRFLIRDEPLALCVNRTDLLGAPLPLARRDGVAPPKYHLSMLIRSTSSSRICPSCRPLSLARRDLGALGRSALKLPRKRQRQCRTGCIFQCFAQKRHRS
jgi:hypothetical protein